MAAWKPRKDGLLSKKTILFVIPFAVMGIYILIHSFAASCTVSPSVSSTTERRITLNLTGCTGVQYFNASESSDFGASSGVQVKINNVAADNSYADLSITYPNGVPATSSLPFSTPATQHQVKMLAVLFTFDDANGQSAGLGSYETTTWLQKLVFGDGTGIGFDGTLTNNSIKDYIFQSTNGRVQLTGQVYPAVIHLPLEKYRKFLGSSYANNQGTISSPFDEDILKAINADNPGFLSTNNFDILLGLSSEQYPVFRDLWQNATNNISAGEFGSLKNAITYSIPVDNSNSIFAQTIQENRTSIDANTVVTRYNPITVEGVWLASDVNRTGTNYYTGGLIKSTVDTRYSYIQLGIALPSTNTAVIVRYKAATSVSVNQTSLNQVTSYGWYSHFMHELQHEISEVPAYYYGQRFNLGDLYKLPANVNFESLMANGTDLKGTNTLNNQPYEDPTLLSGHDKQMLGYSQPYTLTYGQNETNLRIYRAENGDPANTGRSTLIKVPLMPLGDVGLETRNTSTTAGKQYRGSDYLLLEWRSKQDNLENNIHNFDRLLPSDGLAIYHAVEASPYGSTGSGSDIVRLVDATPDNPNLTDGLSDTAASPALFGPQSGVLSYTADSYWQEKPVGNDAQSFDYLLSPGQGTKTIYVKFADANGNAAGNQQITVNLTNGDLPPTRIPTLQLNLVNGTQISSNTLVNASYTAPNGAKNIRFYVDGVLRWERTETVISPSNESFTIRPVDFSSGTHQLSVVFYDGAMNKVTASANFSIIGGGDTQPPFGLSIFPPSNNSAMWGAQDIEGSASDNVGVTKTELYIDGALTTSVTSGHVVYNWDTTTVSNGAHNLFIRAYDASGNHTDSMVTAVTINNSTTSKPGDINGDSKIDILDLSILATNFGQCGKSLSTGDLNNDGCVNVLDLSILASNWGK